MKKIIYIIGIISLLIVTGINLIFTAKLDLSEHVIINYNNIFYIISIILVEILIYFITRKLDKKLEKSEKEKKIRKNIFIAALVIYIILSILWIILVRPGIGGDSIHVANLAQTFYRGDDNEFLNNKTYAGITLKEYIEKYPQQIHLAYVYKLAFKMTYFDVIAILRVVNIIGNLAIIFAIYKICNQLSKQYKTSTTLPIILILTCAPLLMLTTFIYGDIPSLGLSLFAVYYIMKYTQSKKIKHIVIAAILTAFAYMMRMNSLIFIIATVVYLILNLIKEFNKTEWKKSAINLIIIAIYLIISFVPANLVENYYFQKYNLDKNKGYPKASFILMAMEESWRGNGWYNEPIAEPALHQKENIENEYKEKIKERVKYLSKNIKYTADFYTKKLASMWGENTYSAFWNNNIGENKILKNAENPVTFYQKVTLLLITSSSLIIIIQNRKKLSLEVIFLLTIFIGGFAFHILWEAKSRYIIPYIIALIPITSIHISNFKINKKEDVLK